MVVLNWFCVVFGLQLRISTINRFNNLLHPLLVSLPWFTKTSIVLNLAYKINIYKTEKQMLNQRLQGQNKLVFAKKVFLWYNIEQILILWCLIFYFWPDVSIKEKLKTFSTSAFSLNNCQAFWFYCNYIWMGKIKKNWYFSGITTICLLG